MNKEKISVIIPAYNVEHYIERCIESIVSQTYKNLEILIIDDGSTDETRTISNRLAQRDTRIKVIHKENGGLADARNAGLDNATGYYVGFVDADDYIHREMYENMLQTFSLEENIEMVSCGMIRVENKVETVKVMSDTTVILDQYAAYKALLRPCSRILGSSFCTKLFVKSLFDENRFKRGVISEDVELMYKILDRINKVVCLNKAYYYYYSRSNSITTSPLSERHFDIVDIVKQITNFINNKYPELSEWAYAYELEWLISVWNKISNSKRAKVYTDRKKEIRKRIKNNLKNYKNFEVIDSYNWLMGVAILLGCYRLLNWMIKYIVKVKKVSVKL